VVRDTISRHLRHEPTKVSKSRIKRLRGLSQPQYRLRVGDIRVSSKRKRRLGSRNKAPQVQAVALAQVKDGLSKYLHLAAHEEIVTTRHGRPAGVLLGFASDDDWFEYRLEHHPEFLRRVADARTAIREGRGILLRRARRG
jgi:hypothetical protein